MMDRHSVIHHSVAHICQVIGSELRFRKLSQVGKKRGAHKHNATIRWMETMHSVQSDAENNQPEYVHMTSFPAKALARNRVVGNEYAEVVAHWGVLNQQLVPQKFVL